jgi:hypothetical protein
MREASDGFANEDTGAARTEASRAARTMTGVPKRAGATGGSSASAGRAVEGKTLTDKYDPCLERVGLA